MYHDARNGRKVRRKCREFRRNAVQEWEKLRDHSHEADADDADLRHESTPSFLFALPSEPPAYARIVRVD
jgi:hypothetical protein